MIHVYFEKLHEINKIIQTEVLLKLSANKSMLRSPSSLRNKIWILFSKAESSIFAKFIFYFTSLLGVLSIICLGLISFVFLKKKKYFEHNFHF